MNLMIKVWGCLFLCTVLASGGALSSASAAQCIRPAQCTSATVGAGHVTLRTGTTTPGGRTQQSTPATPTREVVNTPRTPVVFPDCRELGRYRGCVSGRVSAPVLTPTEIFWNPVTLEDIADFEPSASAVSTEPQGWSVIDINTNVVNSASSHIVEGTLFGQGAQVRFTPIGVDWNYGDGSSKYTASPGARWSALGLSELSLTSTSHVFEQVGKYVISAVVHYRAEYRYLTSGWERIDGELTKNSSPSTLVVLRSATAVMTQDCVSHATAPGC